MKIQINIKSYSEMRYETCGDYYIKDDTLIFDIADTGNDMYNLLVLVHEISEYAMVTKRGISEDEITLFDEAFEKLRKEGNTDEPGNEVDCIYRDEHCIATGIERMLCGCLNISWKEYEKTINELS
jgi:hypothetical protein